MSNSRIAKVALAVALAGVFTLPVSTAQFSAAAAPEHAKVTTTKDVSGPISSSSRSGGAISLSEGAWP